MGYVNCANGFIPEEHIKLVIEQLTNLIGVYNVSNEKEGVLTKESINAGAEMFLELTLCPSDTFAFGLYWNAIYGSQSKMAILAFNIVKKSKDDLKLKAIKMFTNIASMLGFQHISYNQGNGSFEKNINVKGEMLGTLTNSLN